MVKRAKLSDFLGVINKYEINKDTWIMFGTTDGNTGEVYDLTLDVEEPSLFGKEAVGYANTIYLEFDVPDEYVKNRNSSNNITMANDLHSAISNVLDNYGLNY
jgi:hypothetical protein